MDNRVFQEGLKEIISSVQYMIQEALQNTTQIYDGIVVDDSVEDKCDIKFNGMTYTVADLGNTLSKGDAVKVFVPQGNLNSAFALSY